MKCIQSFEMSSSVKVNKKEEKKVLHNNKISKSLEEINSKISDNGDVNSTENNITETLQYIDFYSLKKKIADEKEEIDKKNDLNNFHKINFQSLLSNENNFLDENLDTEDFEEKLEEEDTVENQSEDKQKKHGLLHPIKEIFEKFNKSMHLINNEDELNNNVSKNGFWDNILNISTNNKKDSSKSSIDSSFSLKKKVKQRDQESNINNGDNLIEVRSIDFLEIKKGLHGFASNFDVDLNLSNDVIGDFDDNDSLNSYCEKVSFDSSIKNNQLDNNLDENNDLEMQNHLLVNNLDEENNAPRKYQNGILYYLLKFYQNNINRLSNKMNSNLKSNESGSNFNIERKFKVKKKKNIDSSLKANKKNKKHKKNTDDLVDLDKNDSNGLLQFNNSIKLPSFQNAKPKNPRFTGYNVSRLNKKKKKYKNLNITVHIADIIQRQNFILKMCLALMLYGAPTHRLEEYMIVSCRVLGINGQFVYMPNCMIISFGDATTRTSDVHLVKCSQEVHLSNLLDTHKIYKSVVHDLIGVEEAQKKLDHLLSSDNKYNPWLCVLFHGIGTSLVCPYAFDGSWIDMPIVFCIGIGVGYLKFFLSQRSHLYSSIFEIGCSIVVSFIARAVGSIRNGELFCFSAICQGSLSFVLPGYMILLGSLELQSRNLVSGSVRMFFAIIFCLFLSFGIALGSAIYGWVDPKSKYIKSCPDNHALRVEFKFIAVPIVSTLIGLNNQARLSQLPVMVLIAFLGYIGSYLASLHFKGVTEFTSCIGAFVVGILGNLYSKIWKGMAVSAMIPAVLVQVPTGIASKGSLANALKTAKKLTKIDDHVVTDELKFVVKENVNLKQNYDLGEPNKSMTIDDFGPLAFGSTVIQVCIGISVGLIVSSLIVYPFGKKKTSLFSL